jgi:outer membrane protein assembly factor BamE (lipoprotein component of BamABCDE complex)
MTKFLSLLFVIMLSGCMTIGNKQIEDEQVVKQIVPGKTTKQEVRALVGEPNMVEFADTGEETWQYILTKSQTRASSFIPYVGLFVGGADMQTHTLTIRFRGEVVSKFGTGKTTGGAGSVFD